MDVNIEVKKELIKDDRLRVLALYQLLLKRTDVDHPLNTKQIQDLMLEEYGISMHRTSVPANIDALKKVGIEVTVQRSRTNLYYLDSREFELPELKILIDAVESSKFITEKKSHQLVEKLMTLTSETNAEKLKRNLHTSGRARSENEKGYYIVDAINEAINVGKRISFQYMDYDINKELVLRHNGEPYIVSPYTLVWSV